MLGNQRRLDRLWEKLTCLPTHGSLPQISHLYAMKNPGNRGKRRENSRGPGLPRRLRILGRPMTSDPPPVNGR